MKLFQFTHDSSAMNLAIDEALLESAEAAANADEVLRIWEPKSPLVVLGRSSPWQLEANLSFCESNNIEILRRCSGGQTIVTGPGCLMYAVLLDYRRRPELRMLDQAHQLVMRKMQSAIKSLGVEVEMQGTSDLTYAGRKFSGNSLRCKRNWMVYHGTMICDFDIEWIIRCLGKPIREPDYRASRSHQEFLTQLPVSATALESAIADQWSASTKLENWPSELANRLVSDKYSQDDWNHKI